MGSLNTIIIRLILDSTLYLATLNSINPTGHRKDFFAAQIHKDIKILSQCLQHSPEESLLLVHFLLSQMKQRDKSTFKEKLTSKENRNKFETAFCTEFISKIIGNDSSRIIKEMTNVLTEDAKDNGSNQLFRIAYEILSPEDVDDMNGNNKNSFNNKKYW